MCSGGCVLVGVLWWGCSARPGWSFIEKDNEGGLPLGSVCCGGGALAGVLVCSGGGALWCWWGCSGLMPVLWWGCCGVGVLALPRMGGTPTSAPGLVKSSFL